MPFADPDIEKLYAYGRMLLRKLPRPEGGGPVDLGDDVALSSGVHVGRLRLEAFVVAGVMTAAAVALAGPVGFVGLIVPHICRLLSGPDHRRLMLISGFAGAILLMASDTFCLCTVLPIGSAFPVGMIIALSGGQYFLFLLRRRLAEMVQEPCESGQTFRSNDKVRLRRLAHPTSYVVRKEEEGGT